MVARVAPAASTKRNFDPVAAYGETLDALVEQMQVRVGSVDNGEKFMRENSNPVVVPPTEHTIAEIQGTDTDTSPLVGQAVTTTGVVTNTPQCPT